MSILLSIVIIFAVLFAGFAIWVRIAPSDAARWHADPMTATDPGTPNFARIDRITSLAPTQAAGAIAAQAESEGAERIAGDAEFGTWVARTRVMRYPDYVSVRLVPNGEGTRIVAFSRARFGYADAGVNAARLRRWVGRLPD